ncbi:MAG: uroporphyrinogen-III synthase [Gammaproteobacteria bacterium]|nr:MAG: uroporphyrinogen-III synthase [Gammaproteobacteria bacterium]
MRQAALSNRTILITRPAGQAEKLIHMIEAGGGRVLSLPVIGIEALAGAERERTARALLAEAEVLVFISVNAVRCLIGLIPDAFALCADRSIYAVGGATCRILQEHGFRQVHQAMGIGSEALLDLPGLQADEIAGRAIVIIRGEGGRDLLRERLAVRGARVAYLEVYRRRRPEIDNDRMKKIWSRNSPDAIVISSAEGLQNLIDMTPPEDRATLFDTQLVAISERVSTHALARGFRLTPRVASEASDEGLFAAIKQLFEERQ